ncbi:MAG: AAA family ATPase [Bacteroidota bacterium]
MNIKFTGSHKAINSFQWIDIPELAVLTGLNGTGKSQLLDIVASAYQTMSHNNQTIYRSGEGYTLELENIEFDKQGLIKWHAQGGHFQFEQYKFGYSDLEKILNTILNFIQPNPDIQPDAQEENQDYTQGYPRLKYLLEGKRERIIAELLLKTGKNASDILPEDILFHLPENIIFEDHDVISQDYLDMIFYLYLYRKASLEANSQDAAILGDAPWIILNKVIRAAGLPYAISIPSDESIRAIFRNPLNRISSYRLTAKLINPENDIEIGIGNLSSGERVIMSLAMLLYYFQHRAAKKNLILFDEIDAHLHPSLTKQFFDVISTVVIKEYEARVIMATHSPSTVALAPVDVLFVLNKGEGITEIESVSKDKALSILTAGVPSLSINYENRRQVFVESQYDAEYYGTVYQNVKADLIQGVSLDFISSGVSGRGNCDQVKEIVKKLNDFGNKSIFGIIDWDTKNSPIENVKILGEQKRYSIESYIFDPVLIGYYLLRQKFVDNVILGLKAEDRFIDFIRFGSDKLQVVSNNILALIKPHFKDAVDTTTQEVVYRSGDKIVVPNWFLQNYGHDLPAIHFKAFPQLLRFRDENGLRKEIINNTVKDIPEMVSVDLVKLFLDIQGSDQFD